MQEVTIGLYSIYFLIYSQIQLTGLFIRLNLDKYKLLLLLDFFFSTDHILLAANFAFMSRNKQIR